MLPGQGFTDSVSFLTQHKGAGSVKDNFIIANGEAVAGQPPAARRAGIVIVDRARLRVEIDGIIKHQQAVGQFTVGR